VDLVEQLGGESLIYTTSPAGHKMIARTFGNVSLEQGAEVGLDFRPEDALIFLKSDGRRVR
jgi:hypothetical protein